MNSENQTDVERLLALAGPRDAVPDERLERMRAAVYKAWRGTPRTRARSALRQAQGALSGSKGASGERPEDKPRGWGPAGLNNEDTAPRTNRIFVWTLVTAAVAAAIVITIVRTPPDARSTTPAQTSTVAAAVQITTGPADRKSLLLPRGGELRVDASSVVTIAAGGEIHISKGALYLDSKGTTLPAVITPAGRITDIGTRFEVRIIARGGVAAAEGLDTRVRVRDGKVRLALSNAVHEVAGAEELLAHAGGSIESTTRRRVDPFGAEWAWVARAAPRFDVEGKSLGSFLDWIEKEGGWSVAFASPALERRARSTVLHGSIEDMSTTEALDTILRASGFVYRVDPKTGRVTVDKDGLR
jgi:hypothetical protein